MNKKGSIVLRDIIMLIIVFSGIIALAGVFVNDLGDTYDNANMTSSYNQDALGETQLQNVSKTWENIGNKLDGNLFDMLEGTFLAAKEIVTQIIKAPSTFVNMMMTVLEEIGVSESITSILGFIITATLYIIIIFVLVSAFLRGGKL